MAPKLNQLIPMIYTTDLQGTVDFYVKSLGFVCLTNKKDLGWAKVQLDNAGLMISKPNDHIPFEKPTFTGSFYFHTDNVDNIWNRVKDKLKVCYPIENFEYGMREFAVYDNNGYLLQFGQTIILAAN
ncbi:VOC family protein [Leptospira perdikensis]|uniref:Bleomycin resistance family protein n=1 Tax=Leptospira perdikensis TaxID=2484948 RepID=A0A4R9JHD5_9LEPT|nr:VOC family protein [Leptospira perdikensis]TGL41496.1 bleomycin resistance family protein [Leptospira perdikensis]